MSSTEHATDGAPARLVVPGPDTPPVGREMDGHLAVLTMQYAPHNFLGTELTAGLLEGLQWAKDQGARAVLLNSGLRNFCAGADLAMFQSAYRGVAPDIDLVEVLRAFDSLPVPIVAAIHGVTVGGGLEIALACDLIISSESAKIGSVEATLGLNPLMGGIQRVTERAGAARAKEMALLARRYDARTLERWNIINRVVPDEKLGDVSVTVAQELANGPTLAHASTKAIVSYTLAHGVPAADEVMRDLQADYWKSEDLKRGLESLAANGPGAARFEGK
ncbi:MAG TPA: enoyl-CoA hydratase/isomerase family protein [Mycobacterium sp.]|jgi:enoyl-CoA hydratase/carnithine racemase|uniref:enoyl-CoA hydratase/isomerase family protein n=1 Tax=Mycobacterium sp. TaxID=1785 RepID=UPI002615A4CD|nr:enoyl-CoA hydratase/isomerase family protein [Mycobacterium sp.]MCW2660879.1 Enoyl-CoA hydratase/isomerase [Mycobacterium sp.]HXO49886.1 enoyl-CoA hydratase/isomerase family protein [Mycobacterium sp.]